MNYVNSHNQREKYFYLKKKNAQHRITVKSNNQHIVNTYIFFPLAYYDYG